jgi:hypothetical protein
LVVDPLDHQAEQRVYEWRASFGSAALSMINQFFDSHGLFKTNESRKLFADHELDNLRFLFSDSESENPKVSFLASANCKTNGVLGISRCILLSVCIANLIAAPACHPRQH